MLAEKQESEVTKHLNIDAAARHMLNLPQVDCPVIHRFGPGLYIREVTVPAGSIAIGHYQKFDHFNVLLKGRVSVLNENGTVTELVAPMAFTGNPGRKIGYVHEDMVWQNIYATNVTDVEKLEKMFLDKTEDFLDMQVVKNANQIKHHEADRIDYKRCLDEFGFTEEQARAQSEEEKDRIDLPYGAWKVKIGDSPIEGKGLFATATIEQGEVIAPAGIKGMRTIAGRFTNHSANPNAFLVLHENGDVDLVAKYYISGCKAGFDGEEITIDYRQALSLNAKKALKNG